MDHIEIWCSVRAGARPGGRRRALRGGDMVHGGAKGPSGGGERPQLSKSIVKTSTSATEPRSSAGASAAVAANLGGGESQRAPVWPSYAVALRPGDVWGRPELQDEDNNVTSRPEQGADESVSSRGYLLDIVLRDPDPVTRADLAKALAALSPAALRSQAVLVCGADEVEEAEQECLIDSAVDNSDAEDEDEPQEGPEYPELIRARLIEDIIDENCDDIEERVMFWRHPSVDPAHCLGVATGKERCCGCQKKLEVGELQLGTYANPLESCAVTTWHHARCLKASQWCGPRQLTAVMTDYDHEDMDVENMGPHLDLGHYLLHCDTSVEQFNEFRCCIAKLYAGSETGELEPVQCAIPQ